MIPNVYTLVHISETSIPTLPPLFRKAIAVPISGLVVTFQSSVSEHSEAVETLRTIREIDVGQSAGSKLAIVIDSETKRRDQEIWDTIQRLPGVVDLAVAMVALDEEDQANSLSFN